MYYIHHRTILAESLTFLRLHDLLGPVLFNKGRSGYNSQAAMLTAQNDELSHVGWRDCVRNIWNSCRCARRCKDGRHTLPLLGRISVSMSRTDALTKCQPFYYLDACVRALRTLRDGARRSASPAIELQYAVYAYIVFAFMYSSLSLLLSLFY